MGANFINLLIGLLFLTFVFQIYKSRNGNVSTGKKTGKSVDKDKKSGGFFNGGGMGDMFGVGKS